MRIAVQNSLPPSGPDSLLSSSPPGAVKLGPTNGLSLTLAVSAGDAQGTPFFWDGTAWVNPGADAVTGLNKVSASFATVPVANGGFMQRSGGGRFWAVLKTGAGTVDYCDIVEADF